MNTRTPMKLLIASLLAIGITLGLAPNGQSQTTKSLEEERLSQSGVAITIIFDDSGSMASDRKMEQAKAAFTQWLGGIPEETKLGLIALNKGMLIPLGRNNRESIKTAVAAIHATGGTPLTRTINTVGKLIQDRRKEVTPYERHIVIIFTDGEDSDGPNESVVEALRRLSAATIESVGIGFHGHGDYMKKGATQYYNAGDSAELVRALKQVASEVDQQSNLVVSPEIQAIMNQLPEVGKIENRTFEEPIAAPAQAPAHKGGGKLIILVIGVLVAVGFVVAKAVR